MAFFYVTVLTVAVVFLILILTYVGLAMKGKSSNTSAYPNYKQQCPDYWNVASDTSNCIIPLAGEKNVGSMYSGGALQLKSGTTYGLSSDGKSINFSHDGWGGSGKTPKCSQQKWTLSNNVIWDGVTNYNNC